MLFDGKMVNGCLLVVAMSMASCLGKRGERRIVVRCVSSESEGSPFYKVRTVVPENRAGSVARPADPWSVSERYIIPFF